MKIPSLETKCEQCGGDGRIVEYRGDSGCKCPACGGAGFIPTDFGAQILDLLCHYLRSRDRRLDIR